MNVSLTPELEKLVRAKVESGRYLSASEVVREALRLLEDRDRLRAFKVQELQEEIGKGLSSGISEPLDIAAVKDKAKKRLGKK